jgi:Tol biopolymer transport system component
MSRRKNLALAAVLCLLLAVPAQATDVEAISVPAPGIPSDSAGGNASFGTVSADGRYVVFESSAMNVVPGQLENNEGGDIFLYDRIAGTTILVSHRAGEPQMTGGDVSWLPVISADGRYVAYISFAPNLVAGQFDTGGTDVFLYDRVSGTTSLVSHVAGLPTQAAEEDANRVGISGDGRWIVHVNRSGELMDGQIDDDGGSFDAFLYDRDTGINTLVSHASSSAETAVSFGIDSAVISADGLWVAFACPAPNLMAGQTGMPAMNVFLYSRASGTNVLVSHVSSSTTAGSLSASQPVISADGSWVAFSSSNTDIASGQTDTNDTVDVFLYDRATGTNTLVSRTSSSATTAGNDLSVLGSLSGDGRYVAFVSLATNLVAGVTNPGGQHVFLYDRVTGTTALMSHAAGDTGSPDNGASGSPFISADGAFVAFLSQATNSVPGQVDANGAHDLFLYHRATGSLTLASHAAGSAATAGNHPTGSPQLSLSSDGAWLAYDSPADDLTDSLDANASSDVFLYDRSAGTNTLVSQRGGLASETAPGFISFWTATAMSNDGRYVAFQSQAPNLTAATDANGGSDVFLRDRLTGTTTLISHAAGSPGTPASSGSNNPAISNDGGTVVFSSWGVDLVPGQVTNDLFNLFHWDRRTGTVALVNHSAASPTTTGNDGLQGTSSYVLSGDGRWVAYSSADSDLVAGQTDLNSTLDVFLFDRATGSNTLVSRSAASPAQAGDASSFDPAISADGRWISFMSGASDLVPGQSGAGGVFLYDRITGTTVRASPQGYAARISADGRWIAFESNAQDLVPGQVDANDLGIDVFLWDRISGATTLASRSASSAVTTGNISSAFGTWSHTAKVLSADGRYLVFVSGATDLVPGQTVGNGSGANVFLFDRVTGATTLVSRSTASAQTTGNAGSSDPVISEDGSRIAFVSLASDLLPSYDPWGDWDFFVYDRAAGTMALASHKKLIPGHAGDFRASGNGLLSPRISADGQVVAFSSDDESLVFRDLDGQSGAFVHVDPLPGRDLFTATPCRVLDTRQQGPALTSGVARTFAVEGLCGIPATARAVVVNVTVVQPSGAGHVVLHPGDLASPLTNTINFTAGATRANNAVLALAFDGTGTLAATPAVAGGGTIHLILDVSGYFE